MKILLFVCIPEFSLHLKAHSSMPLSEAQLAFPTFGHFEMCVVSGIGWGGSRKVLQKHKRYKAEKYRV